MNDPFYDSGFLTEGTAQAEFIYNEALTRFAAAHGRIKSRTTGTPPGAPAVGDAYLVPAGASGAWDAAEGQIAIWATGWKFMDPKAGMRFWIQDEDKVVDFSGVSVVSHAIDGLVTLTPQFVASMWQVFWDGSLGTSAVVTLADSPTQIAAPTNWRPGRIYTLHIIQDGSGGNSLILEVDEFYRAGGDASVSIATGANERTQITFLGPSAGGKPVVLSVLEDISLVTAL